MLQTQICMLNLIRTSHWSWSIISGLSGMWDKAWKLWRCVPHTVRLIVRYYWNRMDVSTTVSDFNFLWLQNDLIFSVFFLCLIAVHLLYQLFENVSKETGANTNGTEQRSNVNLKKFNEAQINNAVLCMNNCVSQCPARKLATRLAPTDIIMDLLYLTRDGLNKDMQKNCGILIAKLCKSDDK